MGTEEFFNSTVLNKNQKDVLSGGLEFTPTLGHGLNSAVHIKPSGLITGDIGTLTQAGVPACCISGGFVTPNLASRCRKRGFLPVVDYRTTRASLALIL